MLKQKTDVLVLSRPSSLFWRHPPFLLVKKMLLFKSRIYGIKLCCRINHIKKIPLLLFSEPTGHISASRLVAPMHCLCLAATMLTAASGVAVSRAPTRKSSRPAVRPLPPVAPEEMGGCRRQHWKGLNDKKMFNVAFNTVQ